MKSYVVAKVSWLSFEEGGRKKIPPKGTRYCPIIKVNNVNLHGEWSVDFMCTEIDQNRKCVVRLGFLSPKAPIQLLVKDTGFELFEGNKKVARGVVL